jgi:bidirectional [NiFe] hydrogenase diaphorase subunit
MSATPQEIDKLLDRAIARYQSSGDALIEVLHVAQQLYGYLSRPLLKTIARRLRLPPSKVLGVATFYHLFRLEPCAAHTVTVCMGTACYAAGSTELLNKLKEQSASDWTIEAGRCLGSCGLAPVVIRDGMALSRVTPDQLEIRFKQS